MDVEDDVVSHPPSRAGSRLEQDSPRMSRTSAQNRTTPGGHTERRPPSPPGPPKDPVLTVPGGSETLKPHDDPFGSIENPRKHKANQEVYTAFIGHSRKHYPSQVKL